MANGVTVSNVATASQQDIIDSLTEQLAKASERLKESKQVRTEYSFLIADLVRRADVKNDLYKNPTYQKASEQLNKFAIEKKIESLEELHSFFLNEFDWKFPDDTHVKFMDVGVAVNARIAQLRKE